MSDYETLFKQSQAKIKEAKMHLLTLRALAIQRRAKIKPSSMNPSLLNKN
jgi:hypothetical protein